MRVKMLLIILVVISLSAACSAQAGDIHDAARSGDMKKLEELVAGNPELVNVRDDGQHTPLHSAATGGHIGAVGFLLEKGADPDARNNVGQSPLLYAAYGNHAEIVELLISRGAAFDYRDARDYSPLLFAARQGSAEVVRLLVGKGAAFDEPGSRGRTALHFSAMNGHTAIAGFLAGRGADPLKKDDDGLTPFALALTGGYAGTAEALLASGAGIEFDEKALLQYLHLGAAAGSRSIVDMMIGKGADTGGRDERGRTFLHNAVIGGLGPLAEKAIEEGADINSIDNTGKTALLYAVSAGDAGILALLLERGADPDIADAEGLAPLHIAEDRGEEKIARALLAAGAVEAPRPVYALARRPDASPAEDSRAPLEITYIANEGFMISGGESRIIIDAVQQNPWRYVSTGERIFSMMCGDRPPLDGIDVCVASHAHADHMLAGMTAELLGRNEHVTFVSSPEACDSVRMAAGDDLARFEDRVISVDPEWNEVTELEVKGIEMGFFGINHAGPGQNPYKTLATIIDLGGVLIAHLADQAAPTSARYYEAADLKGRGVDIVFADRFFLADSIGQHLMSERIDPQHIILMHLQNEEIDSALEELSPLYPNLIVFREQFEKKVFEFKEE